MKVEGRMIVAGFALVVCCAGPVLAGGALLAGLTGFVSGGWGLVALAAVLCVMALLVGRRRATAPRVDRSHA